MRTPNLTTRRYLFLTILLAVAMIVSYLAGTVSVEARWFAQDEDRATTSQIAAVSAAVSLLLLDEEDSMIFLPLVVR
jgi:hypothetical protein